MPTPTLDNLAQHSVLADMSTSGGSPLDLSHEQINQLRTLFADPNIGMWHFAREIFQFRDLKWEIHGPMCQLIGHWGRSLLTDGSWINRNHNELSDAPIEISYRRLMMRIPREYFKTSVGTRAGSLYTIAVHDHNAALAIFNEKEENAESWVGAIGNVVEASTLFQVLYRELIPRGIGFWDKERGLGQQRGHKWGSTGLMFERDTRSAGISELSIEPHGIGGAQAGKHFTHKILDDIIGLKASRSPAVMAAAIEWIDNSRALERPAEGGCELVNHTTWAYNDVYKHMERTWPDEYIIYHRALLENATTGEPDDIQGVSSFPEKIGTTKAYRMKKRDPYVFSGQYQNKPKAGKEVSFDPETFRGFTTKLHGDERWIYIDDNYYDPTLFCDEVKAYTEYTSAPQSFPLHYCERTILLDPAPGKQNELNREPSARNGFVAVARDPWGRFFCLESIPFKGPSASMDPTEPSVLTTWVAGWRAWGIQKGHVEEVNFSALYRPLFNQIIQLDPRYADLTPELLPVYTAGRDKTQRIRDLLLSDHNRGLWYYNDAYRLGEPHPGGPTGYLRAELSEFPHGETVDLIDAQSYTKEALPRPPSPLELVESYHRAQRIEREGGLTGYGW